MFVAARLHKVSGRSMVKSSWMCVMTDAAARMAIACGHERHDLWSLRRRCCLLHVFRQSSRCLTQLWMQTVSSIRQLLSVSFLETVLRQCARCLRCVLCNVFLFIVQTLDFLITSLTVIRMTDLCNRRRGDVRSNIGPPFLFDGCAVTLFCTTCKPVLNVSAVC